MKDPAALDDLLPARALGALDGEELEAVEAALRAAGPDSDFERRAATWSRVVDALADTVAPVAPSEMARTRVLQRIAASPSGLAADPRPAPGRLADAAQAPGAVPVVASRSSWLLRFAAAALLALALWGASDRSALRRELAELRGKDTELQTKLAAVHEQLTSANGEIVRLQLQARIVSAPDMHPVVLAGLATAAGSTARTFISPRDGKALFYAYGLPAVPQGKQYQLWFIAGGKPVSGGVFDVDAGGNASLLVDHVAPLASIQAWAVTLEPTGGLPSPSGAMVLKG